jgi:lipopolysaccharide transport system ATP-binding protein
MPDLVIQTRRLSKQYVRGPAQSHALHQCVRDLAKWPVRKLLGRPAPLRWRPERERFWALRDVDLEIVRGERLGIIGRNGSGKTTLLKILSRIIYPTSGEARIRGRVASLLEVGTGFNTNLAGRENIYLNASIHGLSRQEIEARFDEIVAFSGVGRFLDTPVKYYSSGMYMRLAFAVAAHLDPDVLMLDEVLAVGDAAFQEKCLGKVAELTSSQRRTVIYVSHNMESVASLCTRVLWLDAGEARYLGDPETAIAAYYQEVLGRGGGNLQTRFDRTGTGELRFTMVSFADETGKPLGAVRSGQPVRIKLEYEFTGPFRRPHDVLVWIGLANDRGQRLFGCASDVLKANLTDLPPRGAFVCTLPELPLMPGNYDVHVSCLLDRCLVDKVLGAAKMIVLEGDFFGTGRLPHAVYGDVLTRYEWFLAEPVTRGSEPARTNGETR